MSRGELYAALDVGGQGVRAVVFDGRGDARTEARHGFVTRRAGDRVEFDAHACAAAVHAALAEALAALGAGARGVRAAGLATQRASIVCMDARDGRALTPAISWEDRRAAHWLAKHAPDPALVATETGLRVSPHYGASKMRWCLDYVAPVREAAADGVLRMGPLSSFITAALVADRPWYVDPGNASRTLLYSLRARDWSEPLLRHFGIRRDVLPRCVGNRHGFGRITVAGLEIPLAVVTGDQSAVPFANGAPDPGTLYVNLGTGAFLQRPATGDQPAPPLLLRSVLFQEGDTLTFSEEATVNGAVAALVEQSGAAGLDPGGAMHQLDDWLVQERSPPLFLNGVGGLGSPWWQPDFPSHFVGDGTPPARMAAVAESIVFLIQRNLEVWRDAGFTPARIMATGGLSHVDGICQRLADLSRIAVLRPACLEATARGLAFLLAGCPAVWSSPPPRRFAPAPDAALQERYRRWRDLMARDASVGPGSSRPDNRPA